MLPGRPVVGTWAAYVQGMTNSEIRVRYEEPNVTALEVFTGAREGTEASIFQTIEGLFLEAHSPYVFRAGNRLIVHATVTERGGSAVGQPRAAMLLDELRRALSNQSRVSRGRRRTLPTVEEARSDMPTAA